MFSFQFLCVSFPGLMFSRVEQIQIGPPIICKPFFDSNTVFFEQIPELLKGSMRTAAEDKSHYLAAVKIFDPPQPALILFSLHKRPLFIRFEPENEFFRRFDTGWVDGGYGRRFFLIVLITVFMLTFNTRAVSRIPLPFIAMSKICSLTPGL